MSRAVSSIRKLVVALIGFPLLALGIVLIPLPGPGLLVCLLGLIVLSLEFEWAKGPADKIKSMLKAILDKAKAKQKM